MIFLIILTIVLLMNVVYLIRSIDIYKNLERRLEELEEEMYD